VKGLDVLLQAVAGIRENVRLHIGGKGTLLDHYKTLAKKLNILDRCIFYGGIPHAEVNVFMQKLHCFVSSSRWETFGIAVVEAMACGVPVITTRSGGPDEFVNQANGLLIPVDDSEQLAAAITDMMKNFSRYDAALIRAQVLSRFSEDSFLEKIESVYSDAINIIKT
jgi:glycosyltransferase involved in cell wall biosynthesis